MAFALRPIDMACAEISALGGVIDRNDPAAAARDALLGEVLEILGRYGAVDARDLCSLQQFEAALQGRCDAIGRAA